MPKCQNKCVTREYQKKIKKSSTGTRLHDETNIYTKIGFTDSITVKIQWQDQAIKHLMDWS